MAFQQWPFVQSNLFIYIAVSSCSDMRVTNLITSLFQVFKEDISLEQIHKIISEMIDTYELENTSSQQVPSADDHS